MEKLKQQQKEGQLVSIGLDSFYRQLDETEDEMARKLTFDFDHPSEPLKPCVQSIIYFLCTFIFVWLC